MVERDEDGTRRTREKYFAILETSISRHGGRTFVTVGDAIMAEFPSTIEAVNCAVAVQDQAHIQKQDDHS